MALFGAKKISKENKPSAAPYEATSMQDLYNAPAIKSKVQIDKTATKNQDLSIAYKILVKPLITEKATHLNAANKYVFVVSDQANKINVAAAIKDIYGVKPTQVNLMNVSGKKVARGRIKGQRSDWRKAIVTLKKGETIKVYEGV